MAGIVDWATDLLISRGALVETDETGALRAMLSPELAAALDSAEWLSLRFGAGAGSDDEGEWLDRLGRLLPSAALVTGARLRHPAPAPDIDAGAVLDRELVVQNGIYRLLEDHAETARYYFFTFHYTIESDETSTGMSTVCLDQSACSVAHPAESLLHAARGGLEEDPAFSVPREELARLLPIALQSAQPEVRRLAAGIEQVANRRLARDTERINRYYRDLLRQIEKRIARRSGDEDALARERSRADATRLDRAAKLEDMVRKYSLKIRLDPGGVLVASLPAREISARLIRKKAERTVKLHWNPLLGALESPWCESCCGRAHPLFLCDDRVHCLCRLCLAACPHCGRQFCRACRPQCRCGAG